MEDLTSRLNALREAIDHLMVRLDIPESDRRITALEEEAAAPDFWQDSQAAQRTMRQLSRLKNEVNRWRSVARQIADALELAELGDDSLYDDLASETEHLEAGVERLSFQAMLSGQYDNEDALLAIHAGAGGTDAQDWAEMLQRMYLRWAEHRGLKAQILSQMEGDEAGIKSVTIAIAGDYVYGYLRSERGVHRLVRLSPFDASSRRHTSFALVEVWPDVQDEIDVTIDEKDLQIDTFRASGAGGQHVQKNDTAVRMTHLPTGLVVSCQNQRSQTQNRERALQILKARLVALEIQKQEAEIAALKGEHSSAEWGNQIRSYVLHPYQMVKDHRTDHETGNTTAVLDGRLDDFMEAFLRATVGEAAGS
ncbi:MAG: peptide chain release factor 2 [Anaerolineae bacterium]|nr:peptide chain release factor 2 [Anaerolineae bacterium]